MNGAGVKSFYDGLLCGRVDVALCSFDHNLQWQQATCGGTELIVSGAVRGSAFFSETMGLERVEEALRSMEAGAAMKCVIEP